MKIYRTRKSQKAVTAESTVDVGERVDRLNASIDRQDPKPDWWRSYTSAKIAEAEAWTKWKLKRWKSARSGKKKLVRVQGDKQYQQARRKVHACIVRMMRGQTKDVRLVFQHLMDENRRLLEMNSRYQQQQCDFMSLWQEELYGVRKARASARDSTMGKS